MGKFKVYKEQEPIQQKASESFVAYSKIDLGIATRAVSYTHLTLPTT